MPSALASSRSALALALVALGAVASSQPRRPPRTPHPRTPAPASAAPVAPMTLDALLRGFASVPGLRAHFREEKRVQLLAAPLVSEGTLDYAPPARLVRRTLTPAPATVLIEGARLRFSDGHGEQSIDMNATPVVRQFVDSFLAVVAGDRAALDRSYELDFRVPDAQHPAAWTLTLRPRIATIQRVFRDIELRGAGVTLDAMTLRETSGDETSTRFTEVDVGHRYAPDEAARVFRITP
jgi:Outer membrane lipoprotein carrier protein LolA-like